MVAVWNRLGGETRGILLVLAAMLLFSAMDATAKGLAERLPALEVVWARYAGQTFWAVLVLAPWLGRYLATDRLGLQLMRSAMLFAATALFFAGFRYMELAEMTAIFEAGPLVVTLLAVLVLGERVGLRRWLGVAAGLCGALIIIRPGTEMFSPYTLLPLLAACGYAGYTIATRFLGAQESPFTSLLYTTLIGTLVATLALPWHWVTPSWGDAGLMVGLGLVGMAGQLCLILGLQVARASVVAPMTYAGLLFNTVWGFAFFAEVPDAWTFAGAALIVGAGLYVWHRETKAQGPAVARPAAAE